MISFETFNFDIIVLIIIFFSIIFGAYYGIKREIRHFLVITIPFIILHFSFSSIVVFLEEKAILEAIKGVIKKVVSKSDDLLVITILAILFYILLMLITCLIMKGFKPKSEKLLLSKETKRTRLLGALLGIFEGYFISSIVLCLISNLFVINYNNALTSFISNTSKKISYYSEYNSVKSICKQYNELEYELDIIFGKREKEIYDIALSDSSFSKDLSDAITKDAVLEKYYNYIKEKESLNREEFKIKEELEKYFKYKSLITRKLSLKEEDLDDYFLSLSEALKEDPNNLLSVLRTTLVHEEFSSVISLIENTKSKKIIGDDFAYEIVLANYPSIKRADSRKKNNIFLKYYFEKVVGEDEGKLLEKIK